jgi:hypothetical protein
MGTQRNHEASSRMTKVVDTKGQQVRRLGRGLEFPTHERLSDGAPFGGREDSPSLEGYLPMCCPIASARNPRIIIEPDFSWFTDGISL